MPQNDHKPTEEKRADLRRAALDYHEFPATASRWNYCLQETVRR